MATVNGMTAEAMEAIRDGVVVGDNLILTKYDGSIINAGNVRGPQGPTSNPAKVTTLPTTGLTDGDEVYFQTTAMAALGIVWHAKYRQGAGKWDNVKCSGFVST